MIYVVLKTFLAYAIFDHGLNVSFVIYPFFWHGEYQGIGFDYIVSINPSIMDVMLFFTCHDFPLSCLLIIMFHD